MCAARGGLQRAFLRAVDIKAGGPAQSSRGTNWRRGGGHLALRTSRLISNRLTFRSCDKSLHSIGTV